MRLSPRRLLPALLIALSAATAFADRADSQRLANSFIEEGEARVAAGDKRGALAAWDKAIVHSRAAGDTLTEAYVLNQEGILYNRLAEYSTARERIERGLVLLDAVRSLDKRTLAMLKVEYSGNLAITFYRLNRTAEAIALLNSSLPTIADYLAAKPGDAGGLKVYTTCVTNLGIVLAAAGDVKEAIERTEDALRVSEKAKLPLGLLRSNLGSLYEQAGDSAAARRLMELALADPSLAESAKATVRSNLAGLDLDANDYKAAAEGYSASIESLKAQDRPAELAALYRNRAAVSYEAGDFAAAEKDLRSAVDVLERIRLGAGDESRVSYFAGVFYTYQWLVDTLLAEDKAKEAFDVAESASARVLAERLSGAGARFSSFAKWSDFKELIPEDTVVLRFFNADWSRIIVFAASTRGIKAVSVPASLLFSGVGAGLPAEATQYLKTRGIAVREKKAEIREGGAPADKRRADPSFDDSVRYYRALLADYGRGDARIASLRSIGNALSSLLIRPVEDVLAGKRKIIVIPDGVLSLIPFETLRSSTGRELALDHELSYAQSLTSLRLVWNRSYAEPRKTAAVFAGASYRALVPAASAYPSLAAAVSSAKSGKAAMGDVLAAAGYGQFSALPGTAIEAQGIAAAAVGTDVFLAALAREAEVKRMSASGELARYRLLHFATHGAFLDEAPDLTCLALGRRPLDTEDGFLVAEEAGALRLRADLVTLSACETGLGARYAGEGVAGLAQAFMRAGSNAVLVSLWKVLDEPTAAFMTDFYAALAKPGISPGTALAEAKRRSIAAGRSDPALWAPFVLYGRN